MRAKLQRKACAHVQPCRVDTYMQLHVAPGAYLPPTHTHTYTLTHAHTLTR